MVMKELIEFENAMKSHISLNKVQDAQKLFVVSSENAFSYYAFGRDEWYKACEYLLAKFDFETSYTILCSKLTRFCRDEYGENGEGKAEYVQKYIDSLNGKQLQYFLT
jgi:hypothetical protein